MKTFTLYRDIIGRVTYVIPGKILDSCIKTFECDDFKWGVTIIYPEGESPTKITKEYLKSKDEIPVFLSSNEKELIHTEVIQNIDGLPIDRGLAHLIGEEMVLGVSYLQKNVHLIGTVNIDGDIFGLFLNKKGLYEPIVAGGHVAYGEDNLNEVVRREAAEELGANLPEDRFKTIGQLRFETNMRKTKINAEVIECYHVSFDKSEIHFEDVCKEGIELHGLVRLKDISKLINGEKIEIPYQTRKEGITKLNGVFIDYKDINPEFMNHPTYLQMVAEIMH